MVHCLSREDQTLGDLPVAPAVGHERKHLELAVRQSGRVLACGRSWAAAQVADAAFPQ